MLFDLKDAEIKQWRITEVLFSHRDATKIPAETRIYRCDLVRGILNRQHLHLVCLRVSDGDLATNSVYKLNIISGLRIKSWRL